MTRVKRLKTPQGQRSRVPGEDERTRTQLSPAQRDRLLFADDPAALLYQAFGLAKSWRTAGPGSPKLKLWHELAAQDRAAWRAAFNEYRELTGLGSHVILPLPAPGTALITVSRGVAYVSHVLPLELLRDTDAIGPAIRDRLLPGLTESLDQIYADAPDRTPPSEYPL